jgi:hypothetical protein
MEMTVCGAPNGLNPETQGTKRIEFVSQLSLRRSKTMEWIAIIIIGVILVIVGHLKAININFKDKNPPRIDKSDNDRRLDE